MPDDTRPASAGTGYLQRNDRKTKPSQPDHAGTATVAGVRYYVSAWINEREGKKYFKLSFTPAPEEQRPPEERQQQDRRDPQRPLDRDGEIPF